MRNGVVDGRDSTSESCVPSVRVNKRWEFRRRGRAWGWVLSMGPSGDIWATMVMAENSGPCRVQLALAHKKGTLAHKNKYGSARMWREQRNVLFGAVLVIIDRCLSMSIVIWDHSEIVEIRCDCQVREHSLCCVWKCMQNVIGVRKPELVLVVDLIF